jgi:hypothetical protein
MSKYAYNPYKNSPNDNPALELPFNAGEYLFIVNEHDQGGFLTGELLNGHTGLVPSNFIERIIMDANNLTQYIPTMPKRELYSSSRTFF